MSNRLCIVGMLLIALSGSAMVARDPGSEFNFYDGIIRSPYAFSIPTVASWVSMNSIINLYNKKMPEQQHAIIGFLFGVLLSTTSFVVAEYGSDHEHLGRWTTLALCTAATSIILASGKEAPEDARVQIGITYLSALIGIGTSYLLFMYG